MEERNDILAQRRAKLEELRAEGRNPFANDFRASHCAAELQANHAEYDAAALAGCTQRYALAGRVMARRDFGKAAFLQLQDRSGRCQVYLAQEQLGEDVFALYRKLDIGDIIGVRGYVFITQMGEITIHVKEYRLLSKSLRPLPIVKEKDGQVYDAFQDPEQLGFAITTTTDGVMTRFGRQFDPYTEYFGGALDEVRVYDHALSAEEIATLSCGGGLPELSALVTNKSGLQNARLWTLALTNNSYCPADSAQIDGFTLTQTYGAACTPVITSPASFPIGVGTIPGGGTASGTVTVDFSGCANTARFRATIPFSANSGAVSDSKTLNNQFR